MPDAETPLHTLARRLAWGACPEAGLLTAGQPSATDLAACAEAGIRTVLDLRPPEDDRGFVEPATAQALGLAYECIPVTPETLGDHQFDRVRDALRDVARRPVLLHCRSANRVGALLYPYLVLDGGMPAERAFDVACAVGLRNAGYAELALAYVAGKDARA